MTTEYRTADTFGNREPTAQHAMIGACFERKSTFKAYERKERGRLRKPYADSSVPAAKICFRYNDTPTYQRLGVAEWDPQEQVARVLSLKRPPD